MYLDSNVFIFAALHDKKNGEYAAALLAKVVKGQAGAFTSALALDEVWWILSKELGRSAATREIKRILAFPNLTIVSVSAEHIAKATKLFEEHGLQPRDAIHAAIAFDLKTSIVSDDRDFDKIKGLKRAGLGDV